MTAFPKPGQIRRPADPVRILRDGREVIRTSTRAGRMLYTVRKSAMLRRQGFVCGLQINPMCPKRLSLDDAEFDHSSGRGFDGGKRDDRIDVDGKPQNMAVCRWCNSEKGSRSLEAVLGGTNEHSH